MNVQIKTIFTMEEYVGGHKTQILSLDDSTTLSDALHQLVRQYGLPLGEKLFDGEVLRKGVVIYVNGRNSLVLNHLETPLNDDDEVLIMPPVGGG